MGFKKTLLLGACVMMILGTAISGTLAYYQASLVENAEDANEDASKNVNVIRVFHDGSEQIDQMLPGMTVWQDVEIINKATDDNGRYVFYTYEVPKELVDKEVVKITDCLPTGENGNWIVIDRYTRGNNYVYPCLYKSLVNVGQNIVANKAQKFEIDKGVGYDHVSGKYFVEPTEDNQRTEKIWLNVGLTFNMEIKAYSVSPITETNDNSVKISSVTEAYKFVWTNQIAPSLNIAE